MPALKNAFPDGYYVYELVDPRTGQAFYVGKGKGQRAWRHAKDERRGYATNALKAETLGQLRRAGLEARIHIVRDGMTERRAFRLGRSMIVRGHASLTNISLGSRTAMDRVQAEVREAYAQLKPFCQLVKERVSQERLDVWTTVIASLARIERKAAS